MYVEVLALTPQEIIFEGKAKSVIVPGEEGVFEILPFHKPILSRLLKGAISIDDKVFPIERGVVKVEYNRATVIVEKRIEEE